MCIHVTIATKSIILWPIHVRTESHFVCASFRDLQINQQSPKMPWIAHRVAIGRLRVFMQKHAPKLESGQISVQNQIMQFVGGGDTGDIIGTS